MDTIPNELLIKIIDKISIYDMLPLREVSKLWMRAVDDIKLQRRNAFCKAIKTCNWTWQVLASADQEPRVQGYSESARYGRFVYIFGEENGRNKLYSFNLSTYKWNRIDASGKIPSPRQTCTFAAYKGKLVVFGGRGDWKDLDDTFIFDTTSKQWDEVICGEGSRPTARLSASASVVGHFVVLFGGFMTTPVRHLNDVWLFDTRTSRWNICNIHGVKPPPSASHYQFTTRGGKIIICGRFEFGPDIWFLDINAKSWTKVRTDNPSLAPRRELSYSPVMIDNYIIVVGPRSREDNKFCQHMHVLDCTNAESALSSEWVMPGLLMPVLSFTNHLFIAFAGEGEGEIVLFSSTGQMWVTGNKISPSGTIVIKGNPPVDNLTLGSS